MLGQVVECFVDIIGSVLGGESVYCQGFVAWEDLYVLKFFEFNIGALLRDDFLHVHFCVKSFL